MRLRPLLLAARTLAYVGVCISSESYVRDEILPESNLPIHLGSHTRALQFQDNSFSIDYLESLANGIVNITQKSRSANIKQAHHFAAAFDSAYTFFFTATSGGLAYASDVLGLPLDTFLARAVDSECNAFFLNGVVLDVRSQPPVPPWHDFAISVHADQSLRAYAPDVVLQDDGTARTVVVLYLSQTHVGGELEIYEHYELSEAVHRFAVESASMRCRGKSGFKRVQCETRIVDRIITNTTTGRFNPKKGRLVHFEGSRSHAVRRLRTNRAEQAQPRISLVLEQFSFPPEVLARIPAVWSESRGRPYFVDGRLRSRFVDRHARPRAFGTAVHWNKADTADAMQQKA